MKTIEFIKFFGNEGLRVYKFDNGIIVQNRYCKNIITINDDEDITIDISSFTFDTQIRYYEVIFKYLSTPIEERKEEKKYKLQQKGVSKRLLIWLKELGEYTTGVYPYENENVKTDFTQEEIDTMPECYTHPAVWEQVPVGGKLND